MLITKEISHRQQTRIQRSVRQARFPFLKTVEEFDFSFQSRGTTALGTGWSGVGGGLPRGRGGRTADGVAGMRSTSQLRVPRAEHKREHNPVREVIHNVHRIKRPLPRTPTPFYRHLFLRGTGALTITRIHLDLPSGGGPNLPLLTSIEMTPDASAVVTFHRIHWKGSPEYAEGLAPSVADARVLFGGAIAIWLTSMFAPIVRGTGNMFVPGVVMIAAFMLSIRLSGARTVG